MTFKRQVSAEEGVNLTPLIDVVFLLLIFFMVSSSLEKPNHIKIDIPEASGDVQPQTANQIDVVVDAQGAYSVNGQLLVNSQIDTLKRAIEEVSGGDTSLPFLITGDAQSPYQAIVSVMSLANEMGYVNFSMTTKEPNEGKPQ
ncbi:MAG: biopolymer transporter ExbD [Agarilytica sp.]